VIRGLFKVMLAALYSLGSAVVMATTALYAYQKRKTHGMSTAATVVLLLVAGLLWPLLAIALMQVALVLLAKLPKLFQPHAAKVEQPVDVPESVGLEMAVV
jgi:hypothetical protein